MNGPLGGRFFSVLVHRVRISIHLHIEHGETHSIVSVWRRFLLQSLVNIR